MKLITKLIIAIFTVATPVLAQAEESKLGYLIDTPDAHNVKNGFGECWRTGAWTPQLGVDSCGNPIVAEVEPTPLPVEVAAAEPEVKPVMKMISFSDEALFAFDKSVLKPEGKIMLDGFVRQLNDSATTMTTYDDISITGHTDRIGSNQYNQDLSERRAQTVKDYLVNSNIRTNRINAAGKGEMEPITNAGDCKGTFANVVACLQPDRRVEVRMTGTQTITSN